MIPTPDYTISRKPRKAKRTKAPKRKKSPGEVLEVHEKSKVNSHRPKTVTLPRLRFMGQTVQSSAVCGDGADDERRA